MLSLCKAWNRAARAAPDPFSSPSRALCSFSYTKFYVKETAPLHHVLLTRGTFNSLGNETVELYAKMYNQNPL